MAGEQRTDFKRKIGIIGGGASGLAAAIAAASQNFSCEVTIFERLGRVGKKLLATGNGRCNISNRFCDDSRYHGENPSFMVPAMKQFDRKSTEDFFFQMGLMMVEQEDGKYYPRSLQASSVLDVLRMEAERLSVKTICDCEITDILPQKAGFLLKSNEESFFVDFVIVSAGGPASPQLGGTNSGFCLLEKLGHQLTPLYPSIVQLKTDVSTIKPLSGIKIDGKVQLLGGKEVQYGEILFTDYGISGPPVLQISGAVSRRLATGQKPVFVTLDLAPNEEEQMLTEILQKRVSAHPYRTLDDFFVGMLPKRLGQCVMKAVGFTPLSREAATLTAKDSEKICRQLKNWRLEVKDTNGFRNAQVTAGGINTTDFYADTMESKKVSGLYACG
ncbi:MAG: aminoacetone oxidase family FAD-binding enzyme, partial [Oscillospiraceae bacterium]